MFDPLSFATQAAGGGGFSLSKTTDVRPVASKSGDYTGPAINFGSSAPGITTGQIALIAGAGVLVLWIVKRFG